VVLRAVLAVATSATVDAPSQRTEASRMSLFMARHYLPPAAKSMNALNPSGLPIGPLGRNVACSTATATREVALG
jgi:hypothetical protein